VEANEISKPNPAVKRKSAEKDKASKAKKVCFETADSHDSHSCVDDGKVMNQQ
jgi:hypothetical protein